MDFLPDAFIDMGLNPNIQSFGLNVVETHDTTPPRILYAQVNYGLGLVRLFCTETIDVTPTSLVNLTQMFLVDKTGDRHEPSAVVLEGALFNTTDDDSTLTLTMTETQRVLAIAISGTPGGDDTTAKFDAAAPCVRDISGLLNEADTLLNLTIFELPDEIRPNIERTVIDYNTGTFWIYVDEQIPKSNMFFGNMSISNSLFANETGEIIIPLVGDNGTASLVPGQVNEDGGSRSISRINVSLTEQQRVIAISISGTPGGDGSASFMQIPANAILDLAGNLVNPWPFNFAAKDETIAEALQRTFEEIADVTKPFVTAAFLDFNEKTFTLEVSEFVDITPPSLLFGSKISFTNDTSGANGVTVGLAPEGILDSSDDGFNVTFRLTESQKIRLIAISGTPGGDGNSTLLVTDAGTFRDVAENYNDPTSFFQITEVPDVTPPRLEKCELRLSDGLLTLFADETVDVTPASNVDVTKIFLANVSGDQSLAIDAATVSEGDGLIFNITLSEAERVAAIKQSGTQGGDGAGSFVEMVSGALFDIGTNVIESFGGLQIDEFRDSVLPLITSCDVNYTNGVLLLGLSETVYAHSLNVSRLTLANLSGDSEIDLSGASVVQKDGLVLTVVLTELQRVTGIEKSGTSGGDGGSMVLDVAASALTDIGLNANEETLNVQVSESADIKIPIITNVSIDYTTGILTIDVDETVDASTILVSKFRLVNASGDTGDSSVLLSGAEATTTDLLSFNITLLEDQRVAALAISGTPGGDGAAVFLDVEANALRDIGQNGNGRQFPGSLSTSAKTCGAQPLSLRRLRMAAVSLPWKPMRPLT